MTNQPEAVEALIKILNTARCNSERTIGNRELAQRILDYGFTITPAAPLPDDAEKALVYIDQYPSQGDCEGLWMAADALRAHTAAQQARIERLEVAINNVVNGEAPRKISNKTEMCAHSKYDWEYCNICTGDHLKAELAQQGGA